MYELTVIRPIIIAPTFPSTVFFCVKLNVNFISGIANFLFYCQPPTRLPRSFPIPTTATIASHFLSEILQCHQLVQFNISIISAHFHNNTKTSSISRGTLKCDPISGKFAIFIFPALTFHISKCCTEFITPGAMLLQPSTS